MSTQERQPPEPEEAPPPDDQEAERRAQAEDPTSPERGFEDSEQAVGAPPETGERS
jgi:hypothetical protein